MPLEWVERFSGSRWAGLIGESKRQAYVKQGVELHAALVIYKQVLLLRLEQAAYLINKLKGIVFPTHHPIVSPRRDRFGLLPVPVLSVLYHTVTVRASLSGGRHSDGRHNMSIRTLGVSFSCRTGQLFVTVILPYVKRSKRAYMAC